MKPEQKAMFDKSVAAVKSLCDGINLDGSKAA
jgi:hypothetical protein